VNLGHEPLGQETGALLVNLLTVPP
jgi:hypothetical protein